MIQIGTYIHGDSGISPEEKIVLIKEAGFDFVALGMSAFKDDNVEELVALCRKHGLDVDNIHLTGSKTTEIWSEGEMGDKVCARYCREIKRAAAAGIPKGVAHITWGHTVPQPFNEYGIARLTKMADCAAENGFLLCLENSVYIEYLYATMARLGNHPAIRFTFDSGHRNEFAPHNDLLAHFGHMLAVTHIDDNDGKYDLHLMPFDGNVDWERDARQLATTEFARQRICAETSFGAEKKLDGLTADEVRARVENLPIASEPELYEIGEGTFTSYGMLSYKQYMERLYARLKKLAQMIEANI